jgi:hypothetical protein
MIRPVADDQPAIEHLARVFLSGFQIPADTPPDDVWRYVEAESHRLAGTLPDDEAAAFEVAVRRLIDDRHPETRRRRRQTRGSCWTITCWQIAGQLPSLH